MKKIYEPSKLKEYYKNESVSENYINKRFASPLGKFIHLSQIKLINSFLEKIKPKKILEIAPGPARVTSCITDFEKGVALEYSDSMIKIAKENLEKRGLLDKWEIIQGDAFKPPKRLKEFDLIYSFRFIRHFKLDKRKKIYSNVYKMMHKNSYFMFDVPNYHVEYKFRRIIGEHRYPIYDKLWKKQEIKEELESSGFKIVSFKGIVHHYYIYFIISEITKRLKIPSIGFLLINIIEKLFPAGQPDEWIVICKKE